MARSASRIASSGVSYDRSLNVMPMLALVLISVPAIRKGSRSASCSRSARTTA